MLDHEERFLFREEIHNLANAVAASCANGLGVPPYGIGGERFIDGEVAQRFFAAVLAQARRQRLLSDEHFSVDGTLIEAWAGQKSFQPKDPPRGSPPPGAEGDFKGRPRRNDTHESRTDPEARLYRKGNSQEARLSDIGNGRVENRHGLAVGGALAIASDRNVKSAKPPRPTARKKPGD